MVEEGTLVEDAVVEEGGLHKHDESRFFEFGEAERTNVGVEIGGVAAEAGGIGPDGADGVAASVVELDDLFEASGGTVVEIGSGQGDVAEGGGFERRHSVCGVGWCQGCENRYPWCCRCR